MAPGFLCRSRAGHRRGTCPRLLPAGAAARLDDARRHQHRRGRRRSTHRTDELDGYTYARCGNRRASVCPSCSHEYKGDAWHLLVCGLAGGRGIPDAVADRPCTFVTLTAPSFGPVHGVRDKGPCRARRDKPVCPHGRPLWCNNRHDPTIHSSARRSAPTATTTSATSCGSGTHPSCGGASPSPCSATSRSSAAFPSPASASTAASPTRRSSSSRRAASRTSTSRSGSTVPKDPTARRPPAAHHGGPRGGRQARGRGDPARHASAAGRHDVPPPVGQPDRLPLDHGRRRPRLRPSARGGPSRAGRGVPREVPHQGDRGLRTAGTGHLGNAGQGCRCLAACCPHHRDRC